MMDSTVQINMPDGTVLTLGDWVDRPLFSTADFLTGFSDPFIAFFGYLVGQEVPATNNVTTRRVATERDTNVATAGGLVSTEELLIYAIKPEYFEFQTAEGTPFDATTALTRLPGQPNMRMSVMKQFHSALNLRLTISEKEYATGGLGYFPTGFDAQGSGVTTGGVLADANVRTYANNSWPSQDAVRSFAVPHHVGGTEKFAVEIRNWPGSTITLIDEAAATIARLLIQIRVYIDGMRKRPTA